MPSPTRSPSCSSRAPSGWRCTARSSDFLFLVTAQGTGNPAFIISPQDRADILAYIRHAFRRPTPNP
jgi:hypothetical protein